jgi:hypothetical protein
MAVGKGTIYIYVLLSVNACINWYVCGAGKLGSPISVFIGFPNVSVLWHDVKGKHFVSIGLIGIVVFYMTILQHTFQSIVST